MTRFTVTWSRDAQADLAEIWLSAGDRAAVTIAAAQIESFLRTDPILNGTEAKEGLWGLSQPPLRVLFTVYEADRLVEVVLVKTIER
jgi:plasmid stabilization system protein ParE